MSGDVIKGVKIMVCLSLTKEKKNVDLIKDALHVLGKDNFALIIHGSSFPAKDGEDTGFGTYNSSGGRSLIDYAAGIFNSLQLGSECQALLEKYSFSVIPLFKASSNESARTSKKIGLPLPKALSISSLSPLIVMV